METIKEDSDREYRIDMEIIVDAYNEIERAMGWYYYLDDHIKFPFKAKCIKERSTSPLKLRDIVEVISMSHEEECESEMFVNVQWEGQSLAVPLSQLEGISVDNKTKEAIEDWHYWVAMSYHF